MISGVVVASTIGSGFTNAAGMGLGDLTGVFALGLMGALGIGSCSGTKGASLTWTVLMGMEAPGVRSLVASMVGVRMWGVTGVGVAGLGGVRSRWEGVAGRPDSGCMGTWLTTRGATSSLSRVMARLGSAGCGHVTGLPGATGAGAVGM